MGQKSGQVRSTGQLILTPRKSRSRTTLLERGGAADVRLLQLTRDQNDSTVILDKASRSAVARFWSLLAEAASGQTFPISGYICMYIPAGDTTLSPLEYL